MGKEYTALRVETAGGVAVCTIDNPPCNVMTPALYGDLVEFTKRVERDDAVQAVVFQSADPDFFIAHFDVEAILAFPTDGPARPSAALSDFHLMCERVRTMPKATIVKLAGRAGGGGSEFAASCDMRFGLQSKTIVNQMEVALGILPGGTGTQRLPRLIGRGRALEVCLASDDIDGETLERWGYLNRLFATQDELDAFVSRLAARIAGFPPEAVALCKASILNAEPSAYPGLVEEALLFQQTLRTPAAQARMKSALAKGLQTREAELSVATLCADLSAPKD